MGLDMYLTKVKREQVAYWRKANAIHAWFDRKYQKISEGEPLENCQDFCVTRDDLIELKNTCEKVLESCKLTDKNVCVGECFNHKTQEWDKIYAPSKVVEDPSVAKELLPTREGCLFGTTDYTGSYVYDLKLTIAQIDKILETVDFDEYDIVYCAWW